MLYQISKTYINILIVDSLNSVVDEVYKEIVNNQISEIDEHYRQNFFDSIA
jgi:hypothetical protein